VLGQAMSETLAQALHQQGWCHERFTWRLSAAEWAHGKMVPSYVNSGTPCTAQPKMIRSSLVIEKTESGTLQCILHEEQRMQQCLPPPPHTHTSGSITQMK